MAGAMNKVVIVGMGPGGPEYVTGAARRAIDHARVLAGSRDLLELADADGKERIVVGADIEGALDEIGRRRGDGPVAALVSGDPGLYSFARSVIRRFGREAVEVVPGVSSVQLAFARLGLDWAGALIISAHAADPHADMEQAARADRIAILAGRPESAKWIANFSRALGGGRQGWGFENLSRPGERVRRMTPEEIETAALASRAIALIVKEELLA